jgi:trimeric autotransporter adhesin
MPPIGEINIYGNCCCPAPGTQPPPEIAPYVVSLQGLSGILTIDGQGAIVVAQEGGTILLSLAADAGLGTVTSVNLISSASSAIAISGGPITTAGSITLTIDATLVALAGVTVAADKLIYATGADAFSTSDFPAVGRTLVAQTTQALARTTGLGATTVGSSLFVLANPSAVTFVRINADNTVTARSATDMRTDLGLVIGTNVQAWSADLDSFVTNASWSSNDLILAGGLTVSENIIITGAGELSITRNTGTGGSIIAVETNASTIFLLTDTGVLTLDADVSVSGDVVLVRHNTTPIFSVDDGGNGVFLGNVTAASFIGEGVSLTALNATQLTSGTVPNARISGTYSSLTGTGTLTTGVWNGTAIVGQYGGTGVANTGKTITIGGNFATSGAFACTLTVTAGTNVTLPTSGTLYGTAVGSITSAQLADSLTDNTGSGAAVFGTSAFLNAPTITALNCDRTIVPAATTGAQTINRMAGRVNFAIAATSLVVTCSICTADSIVLATVATNDATLKTVQAVPTGGSFTLFANAGATAETAVAWQLTN